MNYEYITQKGFLALYIAQQSCWTHFVSLNPLQVCLTHFVNNQRIRGSIISGSCINCPANESLTPISVVSIWGMDNPKEWVWYPNLVWAVFIDERGFSFVVRNPFLVCRLIMTWSPASVHLTGFLSLPTYIWMFRTMGWVNKNVINITLTSII